MLKLLSKTILLTALSAALSAQAADTYTLDPTHTSVLWSVNHFGFSTITGKFMAQGMLHLDETKLKNSKVNITVQIKDVMTAIPKFNTHLLSKDFFNVTEFPIATFVSDKVDVIDQKTAKVYGMLTIHGISKPIIFNVTLLNKGMHPYAKKIAIGFSGDTVIKRSDFGLGLYAPNVSDDVKLHIEAEAEKVN